MDLLCKFCDYTFLDGITVYSCFINNQEILPNLEFKLIGDHKLNHSNQDVIAVVFNRCKLIKVPQGIVKFFPNMIDLSIWYSDLESITKDDLKEYTHLENFALCSSKIKKLPGNLFKDFDNLKDISFSRNALEVIEPNLLDGHDELTFVSFRGNVNYNQFYSIVPTNLGDITLNDLKKELYEIFCKNPENVRQLIKTHKTEIDELRKLNEDLTQQNKILLKSEKDSQQIIKTSQNDLNQEIKNLISDDTLKDFKIIIGDHEFCVHKFLLIARSPTLADILRNNLYVENLKLIDIPVEIFEKVLNFIYTDKIPDEEDENFLQIFAAAGRLKINRLKENIAKKIQITEENAMDVLKLSNKYDHNELRNKSFLKIKEMNPKMHFMDEWASETEKVIKAIKLFKEKEEAIKKLEENFWLQIEQE